MFYNDMIRIYDLNVKLCLIFYFRGAELTDITVLRNLVNVEVLSLR